MWRMQGGPAWPDNPWIWEHGLRGRFNGDSNRWNVRHSRTYGI